MDTFISSLSITVSLTPLRILVVRRDNIGDLLCTTALLHGIRRQYPDAYLAVLVSSYNQDVLEGNPDVSEVFVFLKRQQKDHGYGLIGLLWNRWKLKRHLRSLRFDHVILANGGWKYIRDIKGKSVIGFQEKGSLPDQQPDVIVPLPDGRRTHEVKKMALLGNAIGVPESLTLSRLHAYPANDAVATRRKQLKDAGYSETKRTIGIHISSRRAHQRWTVDGFAGLMKALSAEQPTQFLLFWSPGKEDDPLHPGDDEKAAALIEKTAVTTVFPCETNRVRDLIAALSLCDFVVCSDGGAMHAAAALGKPLLCFFGNGNPVEWGPWGVPHIALQPQTRNVPDLSVEDTLAAWRELVALTQLTA